MLGDLVLQLLGARSKVELTGQSLPGEDALEHARAANADLLVVLDDPQAPGSLGAVLASPRLSVLALSANGQRGELVRFRRELVDLDQRLAKAVAD